MRCVVSCGGTSFPWPVFFFGALPWGSMIHKQQEDGCDKGAHQSYLGAERNTPVVPNWVQPCQCCCRLCYPGGNLRVGTLISYNWAQALKTCDSLKLLSIYFDLCVDAIGVVCLLGSDLRTVGNFARSSSSPTKLSMSSAKRRLVIVLPSIQTAPSWSSKTSVVILFRNMLKGLGGIGWGAVIFVSKDSMRTELKTVVSTQHLPNEWMRTAIYRWRETAAAMERNKLH